MDAKARRSLLAWYATRKRDLPWRRTSDPYAVWVSEMMLQQTRVETVIPFFESWMRRFPTIQALASASQDEVMAQWSGLGYYSRARNLHAAARLVVACGEMPQTAASWRELPGVGPYTAGAIASIAFGEKVPCVDGNVVRVVARHAGLEQVMDAKGKHEVEAIAAAWVKAARAHAGDWNQAMMELGATVCTPRNPSCGACPVSAGCSARKSQQVTALPKLPARRPARVDAVHFAFVTDGARVLLVRNPVGALLAGTYGLPGGDVATPLSEHVVKQTGVSAHVTAQSVQLEHKFTHRAWRMTVHAASVAEIARPESTPNSARWVELDALAEVGLSTAMRKAISAITAGAPSPPRIAKSMPRASHSRTSKVRATHQTIVGVS